MQQIHCAIFTRGSLLLGMDYYYYYFYLFFWFLFDLKLLFFFRLIIFFRAPGYDIPTAIDVLTTGSYQRLPTVIKVSLINTP